MWEWFSEILKMLSEGDFEKDVRRWFKVILGSTGHFGWFWAVIFAKNGSLQSEVGLGVENAAELVFFSWWGRSQHVFIYAGIMDTKYDTICTSLFEKHITCYIHLAKKYCNVVFFFQTTTQHVLKDFRLS